MDKIVLGTISLNNMAGGIERNITYLANDMASRGYDVHLISFDNENAKSFYHIDKQVTWHKVGVSKPHSSISFSDRLKLISKIRNVIKYNAPSSPIICFSHGILLRFYIASLFLKCSLICSERNSLSLYKYITKTKKYNINFMMLFLTSAITVQFPSYIIDYPCFLRKKIRSIPNPVFPVKGKANVTVPDKEGKYTILTVTRLCRQKNLEEMIKAFAKIANKHSKWNLKIIGDGQWYETLKKLISELKLENRVFLLGKRSNVKNFYKESHIFCLPSQWEGFPNSLAEALSYGLPSIGYDDCSGVNQLIINEENGLLAKKNGNIDNLSRTIDTLINNTELRKKMSDNAITSVEKYNPKKVFDIWERLIKNHLRNKKK